MSAQFPNLFSPIQIRHKTAKNRIVSTAHVTVFAEDGMPGERYRRYYLEKAKGGAGTLICFGSSSVHPTSPALDWHVVDVDGVRHWRQRRRGSGAVGGAGRCLQREGSLPREECNQRKMGTTGMCRRMG